MMNKSLKALCVRLYRNNHILARCNANYLGFSGINIDANPMLLPKGSTVEVAITTQAENGHELSCVLQSVVTTRSTEGVGLTFAGNDADSHRALRDILMQVDDYRVAG